MSAALQGIGQDPFWLDVEEEIPLEAAPTDVGDWFDWFDVGGGGGGGGGDVLGQLIDNQDGTFTDPVSGDVFNAFGDLIESGPIVYASGGGGWVPATTGTVSPSASSGVTTDDGTPINWGAIINGAVTIITAAGRVFGVTGGPPAGYQPTTRPGTYVGPDGRTYTLNAQGQPVVSTAGAGGMGGLVMVALIAGGAFLLLRNR
jgi:hypothetical protein